MLKKIKIIIGFLGSHKIIAALLISAILGGGYYFYSSAAQTQAATRYVLGVVSKGTVIVSVSGSGQVSASNQVDINSQVSGSVLNVGAAVGQAVAAGTLLAQIDARDAQKTVRDAQANLDAARLSLQKLQQSADQLSLAQAQNALTNAKNNLEKLALSQQIDYQNARQAEQNSADDLKKIYDDGFNTVAGAFLDLPAVMTGLQDILLSNAIRSGQWNIDYYADAVKNYDDKVVQYRDETYKSFNAARAAYDKNFADYKSASRFSDAATVEKLINETYDSVKTIAQAVKDANNLIQFYQDQLSRHNLNPAPLTNTYLANLNGYTGKTNSELAGLLSAKSNIQSGKEAIINAQNSLRELNQNNPADLAAAQESVNEKEISLAKLQQGADPIDLQSQRLTVRQRQNAVADAQQKLADYSIRAPFDGVVAKLDIKKGDTVPAGIALATLITKARVAEISLNEVDAAKVAVGQRATLTFDAVSGLEISGQVAEVDALGTVSQGVVSYNAKIIFDTQDNRIKPGMTVSVSIITNIKQDVLTIPGSAIKSSGGSQYVELPAEHVDNSLLAAAGGIVLKSSPKQQAVEIGLAGDSSTEVINGLNEGDEIIIRSINASAAQAQSSSGNSLFQLGGSRSGGSGNAVFRTTTGGEARSVN